MNSDRGRHIRVSMTISKVGCCLSTIFVRLHIDVCIHVISMLSVLAMGSICVMIITSALT